VASYKDSTSSQLTERIDIQYPVAGANNDSKGFRDNFKYIQAALTATNISVYELQQNTPRLDQTNDFQGNTLKNANLEGDSFTVVKPDEGVISINYAAGKFHSLTIPADDGEPSTITITNLPDTTDNLEHRGASIFAAVTAGTINPTSFRFTATGYTVVDLGPYNQPFGIPIDEDLITLFVEIWAESADKTLYVKKLNDSQQSTVFTNTEVTFPGDVYVDHSIYLKDNYDRYTSATIATYNGSSDAVVIGNDVRKKYGNVALLTNRIQTSISKLEVAPPGGLTNHFGIPGARTGAKFTSTLYTILVEDPANIKTGMIVSGTINLGGNNRPYVVSTSTHSHPTYKGSVRVSDKHTGDYTGKLDFIDPGFYHIKKNAKTYFAGTDTQYVVNSCTNKNTEDDPSWTGPFGPTIFLTTNFLITNCSIGDSIEFWNPTYAPPSVATMYSTTDYKRPIGTMYANTNTFQIVFAERTNTATNYFRISNIMVDSICTTGTGIGLSGTTVDNQSYTGHVTVTNQGVIRITNTATTSTNVPGIAVSTSSGYIHISPQYGYNGYGQRFVENYSPSNNVGRDGDIWYKI